jgi:hypothetical protein
LIFNQEVLPDELALKQLRSYEELIGLDDLVRQIRLYASAWGLPWVAVA